MQIGTQERVPYQSEESSATLHRTELPSGTRPDRHRSLRANLSLSMIISANDLTRIRSTWFRGKARFVGNPTFLVWAVISVGESITPLNISTPQPNCNPSLAVSLYVLSGLT